MLHTEQKKKVTPDLDVLTDSEINDIRNRHMQAGAKDFRQLLKMPRVSLILFALSEKSAKNTAYYFLLEQGLYEKFVEYSARP